MDNFVILSSFGSRSATKLAEIYSTYSSMKQKRSKYKNVHSALLPICCV
jgi:hypothetical protein